MDESISLVNRLIECGVHSSAHGIPSISRKNNIIIKILWLLCIFSSWSYLLYLIILNLNQYFSYKVQSGVEILQESPIIFPVIDICNLSPYKTLPSNDCEVSINSTIKSNIDTESELYLSTANYAIKDVLIQMETRHITEKLDLNSFGYNLSDLIIKCQYRRVDCSLDDFSMYHNFYFGNCFRFNSGLNLRNEIIDRKYVKQTGWRDGLQLVLNTGKNNMLTLEKGFVILIHDASSNNFTFPEDNGISISPGFVTDLAFNKRISEQLPFPYTNCMGDLNDTTFDYLINSSNILTWMKYKQNLTKYVQNYCVRLCFQKHMIDKCGCQSFDLPSFYLNRSNNSCFTNQQLNCLNQVDLTYFNSNADDSCFIQCPTQCTQIKYDVKISTTKTPSEWYVETFYGQINKSKVYEMFEKGIAILRIHIDEMSYTHSYQVPDFPYQQLLATIGGSFGLFAGFSILTFIEIIDLIFLIFEFLFDSIFFPNRKD